jgi:hypothetical protein
MKPSFTLLNTFHGTSCRVRAGVNDHNELWLTASQAARARRALCGVKFCACGGVAGQRMEHCPTIIVEGRQTFGGAR